MPLPDAKANFSFRVQAPFGSDQVWAFAIDREVPSLPGEELGNGLILMSLSIDQIRQRLQQQAVAIFDESSKTIVTKP